MTRSERMKQLWRDRREEMLAKMPSGQRHQHPFDEALTRYRWRKGQQRRRQRERLQRTAENFILKEADQG